MKKNKILFSFLVLCLFIIGGCKDINPFNNVKAGFIYNGPKEDGSWSKSHEEGRLALEKLDNMEPTVYLENIPESFEAARAIEELIEKSNCNHIFATSVGYNDAVLEVAQKYPEIKFMTCAYMEKNADNVKYYSGKIYQAMYLSGMLAAYTTKTNIIGYIASYPCPMMYRCINAYALGAQSVNKNIKVYVAWVDSWFDPGKEMRTSEYLLGKGCDVLAQGTNSPAPQQAAEAAGAYSIGIYYDMKKYAAEACLTSVIFTWGVFYKEQIEESQKGDWNPYPYFGGMETGIVGITDISRKVPKDKVAIVKAKEKEFKEGKENIFNGPIYDNKGKLIIPNGVKINTKELAEMNWEVMGIENISAND